MLLGRNVTGLLLVAALAASGFGQTAIYVDQNADQTPHDGSDWCHAYLELHEGLTVAGPDTIIRVADGRYTPDASGLGDPREATFHLADGVTIEGGYAGCGAPDPDERNIALYETILSGDIGAPDDNSDNCYHVVIGSGTDSTAVLDGVSITGGNANGSSADGCGGGMYNGDGRPTLTNCTFSRNSADYGGGMCNYASPTLTGCTFSGNVADYGAGMYNESFNSSPTLTACTFDGNSAYFVGGGMANSFSCTATLTNCTFNGNSVEDFGGGMYNAYDSSPTLVDCTFIANSTARWGAGMCSFDSSPMLTNCTFTANTAGWWGGGMVNRDGSHVTCINCTFRGNRAVVHSGGGMCNIDSRSTLTNCAFIANSTEQTGGGVDNSSGNSTITSCTFFGNGAASYGGGMCNSGESYSTLTNCILWGNTAPNGPQVYDIGSSTTTVVYSCIQGGWPGKENIDEYPRFVAGYYLAQIAAGQGADSPCVDAGDPASPMIDGTTRTDGVQDSGIVDMGYHYDGPACLGDLGGDGYRNVTDFTAFAGAYGMQFGDAGFTPYADLNGDGFINVTDFSIFAGNYGTACP